ncbi:hypothetical protein ML462_11785 [Gramella lutea]|uniref:Uncharacterized protein n=1 Tax=Christiangramia lutea TaxID=1607951 RepID=A0A9X1V3S9_9FLAO|nr:hypothetical protein [Christiangramia lutea]MCH4823852.1 hypothetical protein [Christiangramia lutea]
MDIAIILISGIAGALLTFLLNNKFQLGGVMASAGVSVFAGGFFFFIPDLLNENLTTHIPLVVMGTSFIGMATSRVIKEVWIIGLSGLTFSIIYLLTGSFFEGYGGSLGTTAAISLIASYSISQISK